MDLREAQTMWQEMIEGAGGDCPCCQRYGRIYERPFNSTMSKSLIWLANTNRVLDDGWVHVPTSAPKSVVRTNQLATARWWNLIERMPNDDPKVKHSGMWRTTRKGRRFARGLNTIPSRVFTYNGEPIGYSDDAVGISETFETHFDYEQVMNEYGPEGL